MNRNPRYRPPSIRLVNALGVAATSLRLVDGQMDADQLMARACRQTGLEDFGPADFLEPLRILVECYNTEARLNFIGRMSAKTYLLQLLENRLRVEQDRKEHPAIARQQIQAPVFILGLPRTGSTLLFELMAQNAALRAPLSWEVMLPSPPPRAESFQSDPRIRKAQRMLDWVERIAPEFKHIHEVGALRPQECLPITSQAFRSIQFHTTNHLPTYQAWLNAADLTPAYEYHRRMLQQFQAFGPRGTWVLKAPAHLFGIAEIFRVYPDARIVQTHRDPVRVIGSIASHCVSLRQAFSEQLDLDNIGSTWCWLWSLGLERTFKFRREHPELEERFLDVPYEDLTRDPVAAVERIHQRFELPVSQGAFDRVRAYLAEHPKGRHGTHRYQLEDYGLDPGRVLARFAGYDGSTGKVSMPASVPPEAARAI
ncbi:MAG: sulfotransferase [Verrucomicrobia bacterium]|nr:sulfotransferase [Verrucomicrobiota bacterium]